LPATGRFAGTGPDRAFATQKKGHPRAGSNEVGLDGSPNAFGRSTCLSLPEDLFKKCGLLCQSVFSDNSFSAKSTTMSSYV
jgi:hypothetical protein